MDDWNKGTHLFKEKLTFRNLKEYSNKIKSLNYKVNIRFVYNEFGLRIEVINNTPIPKIDENRLRKKFAAAMKYESISDYYMENADHSEGEGLGIALIIILLKNQGLNPEYLRIGSKGDRTIARVEIPFSNDYIPYREVKYKEKLQKDLKNINYQFK